MKRDRRPSPQTAAVIAALAQEPEAWRYGYDLCQQLGMKAGSMYPILMRLADRGLLETTWATEMEPGRPPSPSLPTDWDRVSPGSPACCGQHSST